MIYIGIDDTDIAGSPGTNQLARAIVADIGPAAADSMICRHQLLVDPRVPYTSKNGSASISLPRLAERAIPDLVRSVRAVMRGWFIEGSDPGLCVASEVSTDVQAFARVCQTDVVTQDEARSVAARAGVQLEGLGGTDQGIIGALAAVGHIAGGNDGRVVHLAWWPYPDQFNGLQDIEAIRTRGVDEVRRLDTNALIERGAVDVGKRLRPNLRGSRVVLFVEDAVDEGGQPGLRAVKLT